MMFLQSAPIGNDALAAGGVLAILAGLALFLFVIFVAVWIYMSLAYMAIAKRGRSSYAPGIAWIPVIGPALIASNIAKMPWWPVLLLIGAFIPVVGPLFSLAFTVFNVIWHWKVFPVLGRPEWWGILMLIPIVNLVLLGIAAWGKK